MEIWPAQHYSPIHSHGGTSGIIHCLAGRIDLMIYEELGWNARKVGLLTLTPGQCAWLSGDRFGVHRVHCPMNGGSEPVGPGNPLNRTGEYAVTFHVYQDQDGRRLPGGRPPPDVVPLRSSPPSMKGPTRSAT